MKNILFSACILLLSTISIANANSTNEDELRCLARNIYHEARGESIQGQRAVAFVTLNRMESDLFPDSICDVVWQRSQFSWTSDGASDIMRDTVARESAIRIAKRVLDGELTNDPTNGALFFHTTDINPSWSRRMEHTTTIGNHEFYALPNG